MVNKGEQNMLHKVFSKPPNVPYILKKNTKEPIFYTGTLKTSVFVGLAAIFSVVAVPGPVGIALGTAGGITSAVIAVASYLEHDALTIPEDEWHNTNSLLATHLWNTRIYPRLQYFDFTDDQIELLERIRTRVTRSANFADAFEELLLRRRNNSYFNKWLMTELLFLEYEFRKWFNLRDCSSIFSCGDARINNALNQTPHVKFAQAVNLEGSKKAERLLGSKKAERLRG